MPRKKGKARFCPHCGVSFYSPADLKEHIRAKHGDQSQQPPSSAGTEPADNQPTTELPPGNQGFRR
jgi:hypothetical protein